MIHHYDTFMVTFRPVRTDDLSPEAAWWIGRTFEVHASFIVDEGPYAGQWAFEIARKDLEQAGTNWPGWLPQCDLVIVGDGELPSWRTKVEGTMAEPVAAERSAR